MACRLFGVKALFEQMLDYCQLYQKEYISMKFYLKLKSFHLIKCIRNFRLQNVKRESRSCMEINPNSLWYSQASVYGSFAYQAFMQVFWTGKYTQ